MLMSFAMTCLPSLRCLLTIIIFNILTSSAKVILTNKIIANLSNGPVKNVIANSRMVGRTLTCNYQLFHDLTKAENKQIQVNNGVFRDSLQNEQLNKNIKSTQEMNEMAYGEVDGFYHGDEKSVDLDFVNSKRKRIRKQTREDDKINGKKVIRSIFPRSLLSFIKE